MRAAVTGSVTYFLFDNLSKYDEIVHGVFSRHGGVSGAPFGSLNTSFAVGDDRDAVIANRKILCRALDVPYPSLVVTKQVHGTDIAVIEETPRVDDPLDWYGILPSSDAMLTAARNRILLMTFADCVPLLLYDPINHVVGIAHGGWKGTVARIAQHTIEAMARTFNSAPATLVAAIGPAIGPCCYEVKDEVISAVRESFANADDLLKRTPNGSVHFDLWEANRSQLLEAGIPEPQLEVAATCTACHTDTFFSHRAEQGKTGRFATLIGLK